MERDAAEVLRDALALSTEVRAMLIDSLISSLDQAVDAAAEEVWREEIYRRLQIDSEAVHLFPGEEAPPSPVSAGAVTSAPVRIHPAALEEAEASSEWVSAAEYEGCGNIFG